MRVEKVYSNGKEIIIVGTAHVSQESVELAKKTIIEEKPDVVGVELDAQRYNQLLSGEKWGDLDISSAIKSGQAYLLLVNVFLSNIQRQLGEKIGVKPGEEMLQSVNTAKEQNIPIELLDRDIKITFSRALNKMGLIEKIKFIYFAIMSFFGVGAEEFNEKKLEELKETDLVNELIQQLSIAFPSIKQVLVDERDEYIAGKIRQTNAKKIVAVIGLGHLQGVKKFLDKEPELEKLMIVEKKPSILNVIKYLIPLIFIALFFYAFFTRGLETTFNVFLAWFLTHAILSALGVLVARGHWKSALTAFIAAPFTALHPLLAAGWFAGLTEAKIRNPKIKDFEELKSLNSFSDFSKNQVTRILLVVALSNIGSSIATIIAFPLILQFLI